MSAARAGGQSRHARPTMKDVAALAGVAIKTVSRVMNGDQTVVPDLAARIRDPASKLGYRPNQHALEKAGLQADPLIVRHGLRTIEAATQAATELIRLADQNLVTIGTVKALSRAGLQEKIALVGFDDFVLAEALVPGSPSSPRTRRGSAAWLRSYCSRALTGTTRQRARTWCRPAWSCADPVRSGRPRRPGPPADDRPSRLPGRDHRHRRGDHRPGPGRPALDLPRGPRREPV